MNLGVTLYNKVLFVEQFIYYTIYSSLLTLVNNKIIIHC